MNGNGGLLCWGPTCLIHGQLSSRGERESKKAEEALQNRARDPAKERPDTPGKNKRGLPSTTGQKVLIASGDGRKIQKPLCAVMNVCTVLLAGRLTHRGLNRKELTTCRRLEIPRRARQTLHRKKDKMKESETRTFFLVKSTASTSGMGRRRASIMQSSSAFAAKGKHGRRQQQDRVFVILLMWNLAG